MDNKKILSKQAGATLIETMVALVVGLLLILAATSAFIVQRQSFGTSSDSSSIRESARLAMTLAGRDLRLHGHRTVGESPAVKNAKFKFTKGDSDSFVVEYYGSGPLTADGTISDCNGTSIASDTKVTSTYSITVSDNISWLTCTINGNNTLLIPNIEEMKLRIGVDSNADGSIDYWTYDATADLNTAETVLAVDLSLIIVGKEKQKFNSPSIDHFNDEKYVVQSNSDGRIRYQERMTIALRNILE